MNWLKIGEKWMSNTGRIDWKESKRGWKKETKWELNSKIIWLKKLGEKIKRQSGWKLLKNGGWNCMTNGRKRGEKVWKMDR